MYDILTPRLSAHGLVTPCFSSPYEVVGHLGAIQAQDIPQATWCLGSRISGSTKKMIKQACTDGSIVRTRPMRGTLHYLAPENVHRMLDLCASKTLAGFAKRRAFLGITDAYADRALEIISNTLRGGKSLTRTALGEALREGGIPMQTQRVYHLSCYAATRQLICFGPPTDTEETFVLLDDRIPKKVILNPEEQLAKLAMLYFRGHGPATVDDLAWWCGLGKTLCKSAIALLKDELQTIAYNGKIYYFFASSVSTKPRKNVHLLGGFDEYFLGYKDRSIVADVIHHGQLFTTNGIFFPLIMLDGRIVGTRKRTWKKNSVTIVLHPLP